MPTFTTVQYDGNHTVGPAIYNIKETLVAEGWTVRGSGDGLSRHGDIDGAVSVPLAQRGSGGEYDCWTVASTAFSGVAGGAGNTDAWCWLRSPSGDRDVILTSTIDGFTDSDGRVGYTRKGAGGFVGGATNATTFPAVPAGGAGDELWATGSRANDGALTANVGSGTNRHDVVYADGEWWWRIAYYDTGGGTMADAGSWSGIFPLAEGTEHPNDPDPVLYGRLRLNVTDPFGWWEHATAQFVDPATGDTGELSSFATTHDGLRVMFPMIMENGATNPKGTIDPTFMLTHAVAGTQGDRVTMPDGRVLIVAQVSSNLHLIVPDGTAALTDVTMTDLDGYTPVPEFGPSGAGGSGPSYVNRVWDTTAGGGSFVRWITEGAEDSAGASYPGPGTFGVDTSDYVVEAVR